MRQFRVLTSLVLLIALQAAAGPPRAKSTPTPVEVKRERAFAGKVSFIVPPGFKVMKQHFPNSLVLESPDEPSEAVSCPRCIQLTLYESLSPDDSRCSCSGHELNPTLSGAVCDVEERWYTDHGYAGLVDRAEACLTDGQRAIVITTEPPTGKENKALLLVATSLRFHFPP